MTPSAFSAIISHSAPHCGHHARRGLRPRRTRSESVSIVIFVCFAIALALACRYETASSQRVPIKQDASLPECRARVFIKPMIISDDFSRPRTLQKRKLLDCGVDQRQKRMDACYNPPPRGPFDPG